MENTISVSDLEIMRAIPIVLPTLPCLMAKNIVQTTIYCLAIMQKKKKMNAFCHEIVKVGNTERYKGSIFQRCCFQICRENRLYHCKHVMVF